MGHPTSTTLVVDDGPETSGEHPYGSIGDLVILDADTAFFSGLEAFQNTSLFAFNPTTGVANETPVAGYAGIDIVTLAQPVQRPGRVLAAAPGQQYLRRHLSRG